MTAAGAIDHQGLARNELIAVYPCPVHGKSCRLHTVRDTAAAAAYLAKPPITVSEKDHRIRVDYGDYHHGGYRIAIMPVPGDRLMLGDSRDRWISQRHINNRIDLGLIDDEPRGDHAGERIGT